MYVCMCAFSPPIQKHVCMYYIETLSLFVVPLKKACGRNTLVTGCQLVGASCSSVVRAFAHGAMGRRINPSW